MTDSISILGSSEFTGDVTEEVMFGMTTNLRATGSIDFNNSDAPGGVFHVPSATPVGTTLGTLTVNIFDDATGGADNGMVDWTYSVGNSDVQYLAAGETRVEEFDILILAYDGEEEVQRVAITITGTNDGPTISSGAATDSFGEDAMLAAMGTFAFTDIDIRDTHTASVSVVSSGTTTGLALDNAALAALLSTSVTSTTTDADGTVNWTFAATNPAFQYLTDEQTLTLTYTVTIDDGNGGTASQTVTIDVAGSNDVPTITAATTQGGIVEAAATAGTPEISGDASGGGANWVDLDFSEDATLAITQGSFGAEGQIPLVFDSETGEASLAGTYGTLFLKADGTYRYVLNNDATVTQALDTGDTPTELFNYTIEGTGAGTAASTITISIAGSNDAPVLNAITSPAAFAEDGVSPSMQTLNASGMFSVSDVDANDTLTPAVAAPTVTLNGMPYAGTMPAGLTSALTIAPLTQTSASGTTRTFGYTYDAGVVDLDFLAAGETLAITYAVTVGDGTDSSNSQNIVISITGTNDAPVISSGPATETLNEDAVALSAMGNLTFDDVDLSDAHTTTVSVVASGTGNNAGLLLDNAALTALLSATINDTATGTGTGAIDWAFAGSNSAFQYLQTGETLSLTYTVAVADGSSESDEQTVTINITGTNDAPVLSGPAPAPAAITEGNGDAVIAPQSGSFAVSDVDFGAQLEIVDANNNGLDIPDVHAIRAAATFTWVGADGTTTLGSSTGLTNLTPNAGTIPSASAVGLSIPDRAHVLNAFQIDSVAGGSNGIPLTVTWSFSGGNTGISVDNVPGGGLPMNVGEVDVDFLATGEKLIVNFPVTVTDEDGLTVVVNVPITFVGTNDAPSVNAANSTGAVTEDAAATLTASGTKSYTEMDTSDGAPTFEIALQTGAASTVAAGAERTALFTALNDVANRFTVTPTPTAGTNDGTLVWNFSVADSLTQFLKNGETVTVTYGIDPLDANGVLSGVARPVTITITGTNDGVVAVEDTASVTESGIDAVGLSFAGTPTASGNVLTNDTDVDANDTKAVQTPVAATGTYGSITIAADGSYTYTLDNLDTDTQALAVGETGTDTFSYTVVDSAGATSTSTLTITVTGTNDAPEILLPPANAINNFTESNAPLTFSGALPIRDIDVSDLVTGSFTFVSAVGVTNGIADSVFAAMGSFDPSTDLTNGGVNGSLTGSFNSGEEAFDFLAEGETLTLTYRLAIADGNGGTDTQDVQFVITGTNDAPVVSRGGTVEAALTEVTGAGTTPVVASGSFSVTDLDVSDVLTITGGAPTVQWSDGKFFNGGSITGASFSFTDGDTVSNTATVNWSLDAGSLDLNFLGVGETLTITVPVTITDDSGTVSNTVVQPITVIITGTNDAPVITNGDDSGAIAEPVLTGLGATTPASVTGSFDVADADANGSISFASTFQSFTTNYQPRLVLTETQQTALAAGLTFGPLTGNDGTVTWTYSVDNSVIDFLVEAEVLTTTLLVTADDGNGGTTTTSVAITITGRNDAVVQTGRLDIAGNWTEGAAIAPATTGVISYTDADFSNHGVQVTRTGGTLVGTGGTMTASNALNSALDDGNGVATWSYTLAPTAADYLALGETATETFRVRILDTAGVPLDTIVTITITGTNDAPIITSTAAAPAAFAEDAVLVADGTFSFDDVDLTDAHTTTATLVVSGNGDNDGRQVSDEELAELLTTSIGTAATGAGAGSITWAFAGSNADFQYLQAGETLTLTYTVTVTDDNGVASLSDSETVTITITGTNDGPVAVADKNGGDAVVESGFEVAGDATATGNVLTNDTDADFGDTKSVTTAGTFVGTYGSLTIAADGSYTYTLDNADADTDALDDGETGTDVFNYTVTDSQGATATASLTITVNGTNDAPTVGNVLNFAVTEGGGVSTVNALTGAADVDGDALSVVPEIELPAGVSFVNTSPTEHFSFDASDRAYDYLATGETTVVTVNYGVSDGDVTVDDSLTFTVTGTNDDVTIGDSDLTGAVTEDATMPTLTDTGIISFDDIDLLDTHSVSATAAMGNTLGGTLVPVITDSATGAGDGTVTWTYTLANSAAQYLGSGDTATESFIVTVNDGQGSTDSATVIITVTGTNDTPVVTSGGVTTATLAEAATATGLTDLSSATGTFTVTDVDTSDTLTVTAGMPSATGSVLATLPPQVAAGLLAQVVAAFSVEDIDVEIGNSATVQWAFTGMADFNALNGGDTVTITIPVTITDVDGASVTQPVVITITGSNDGPVINVGTTTATGGVTEDANVETLTTRGSIGFTDSDISDTHETPTATAAEGTLGTLLVSLTTDSTGDPAMGQLPGLGAVAWAYSVDNINVQYLAAGQTKDEVFTVTITDDAGVTATQTVTVTITGTNDGPVLSEGGVSTAAIIEVVSGLNSLAAVTGSFDVSDVDVTDTLTATANPASFTLNGDDVVGPLAAYLTAVVADGFVVTDSDPATNLATVNWSFHPGGGADFNALADGDVLVATIPIVISDGTASVTRSVVITVTGTNDAPVITAASEASGVSEDGTLSLSGDASIAGGNWFDIDNGEDATLAITLGSAGAAPQAELEYGEGGEAELVGTFGSLFLEADGTYRYVVNNTATATQALDSDQTVSDVFNYTINDGSGTATATAVSTITVSINGNNDAATIVTTNRTDVTESNMAAQVSFSIADQVAITDVDTQDAANAQDYVAGSGVLSTASALTPPTGTLLSLVAFDAVTGAVSYDRAAFNWLDDGESVTYAVAFNAQSGDDGVVAQTLTFTINGKNDAPVTIADTLTLTENVGGMIDVIDNDRDPDTNDAVTLQSVSVGAVTGLGTLSMLELADIANDFSISGNMIVFTPAAGLPFGTEAVYDRLNAGQTGTITLTYIAVDDSGVTTPGTFTLTINGAAENFTGTNDDDNPFNGSNGDDTISGGAGDDNISGNSGNDTIFGEADDDIINGGSGDDNLYGGAGSNTIIGGSNTDTVYFDGSWSSYTIALGSTPGTFTFTRNGDTDTVATVEFVSFNAGDEEGDHSAFAIATVINDAPTTENASFTVAENSVAIGTVSASDVDAPLGDTLSYAITGGNTGGTFLIDKDGVITVDEEETLDFEDENSYTLTILVTDAKGLTATSTVLIGVTDVNDNAPVITSPSFAPVDENTAVSTVIYTVTSDDVDTVGGPTTYSLGGADAALFSINENTGAVSINVVPDFETDNRYDIDVIAFDGVNSSTQSVVVTIADLNDNNPVFTSGTTASVDENVAANTLVYTAVATDVDTGFGPVTYSLSGADAAAFAIDSISGAVTLVASPDFETRASYAINVVATQGITSTSQAVTISVNDLLEATPIGPVSITGLTPANEGTSTGQTVATAAAIDVNPGDTVSYSLTNNAGGRFAIDAVSGVITVTNGVLLDFEQATSHNITVRATSSDTSTSDAIVTVSVTDVAAEVLVGTAAAETVVGGGGNDNFALGGGNDNANGGGGDDVLAGGSGVNVLNGGTGIDTVTYAAATGGVFVNLNSGAVTNNGLGGTDTVSLIENVIGSGFNDTIVGNALDNDLSGGAGADSLIGLGGNDILRGGTGPLNTLQGGSGNDTYFLDISGDSIVEALNEGTDEVRVSFGVYTIATNVENLVYTGSSTFLGVGNTLDNMITGGVLVDQIFGRDGNDIIHGGSGAANTLFGQAGDDTYVVTAFGDSTIEVANEGTDTVQTALTGHTLRIHVENLTYTGTAAFSGSGNASDNVITGGAGADTLSGFAGNDRLIGGGGANTLLGGSGNDVYVVTTTGNSIIELANEGSDTVETNLTSFALPSANVENLTYTGSASFTGVGNALDNVITAGNGGSQLNGNDGADTLIGGTGADRFYGGNGSDTITTGSGADRVFLFGNESGIDTVTDFTTAIDKFFLNRASYGGTASLAFVSGAGAQVATTANSTVLYNQTTGGIFLDADGTGGGAAVQIGRVSAGATLAAGDFIFY